VADDVSLLQEAGLRIEEILTADSDHHAASTSWSRPTFRDFTTAYLSKQTTPLKVKTASFILMTT
jgi:hypothetical protein